MAQILQDLSNAMASTVEELTPSIVTVDARRRMPATGVIHSADGIIVTSHHVIESDENVGIVTSDGTRLDATLVGRDPYNDLAVLRVNASDLAPVSWAEADALKVGNLVLALGKPGEQVQATLGVVSSLVSGSRWKEMREALQKRHEEHGGGMRRGPGGRGRGRRGRHDHGPRGRRPFMGMALADGHIATDVVMYPGFSGGPLVSGDGLIHGVNTSGFGRGISISVPVSTIASTIDTLLTHGRMRQGYMGVGVQPARLPEGLVEDQETGLLVVSVEKDSPAANAGLIVGDIIVALDDESVTEVDELLALLTGDRAGQEVSVDVVRGGVLQSMTVTIAERV